VLGDTSSLSQDTRDNLAKLNLNDITQADIDEAYDMVGQAGVATTYLYSALVILDYSILFHPVKSFLITLTFKKTFNLTFNLGLNLKPKTYRIP
jgi:hypothetical protein